MKFHRVSVAVGFVAGLLVGLIIAVVCSDDLEFDAKLSLGDLLAGLVALTIAFLIGHILRERSDIRKAEVKRLVARVEAVVKQADDVRAVEERYLDGHAALPDVLREVRRLSNALDGLKNKLRIYEKLVPLTSIVDRIDHAFLDYRQVIGETEHMNSPPTDADSNRKYEALSDELDRLIRELSRMN